LKDSTGPVEGAPNDWRSVELGDLAKVKYGKAKPPTPGAIPAVGSGGVFEHVSEALVAGPTIVVGRKGTAGRAWLVHEPCWPTDTTFYIDEWIDGVDVEFVYASLILNPLSGDERTTLPSLKRHDLQSFRISLPSWSEQRAITHVLRTVQRAKEQTEQVIAAAEELRRSLMTHLFTFGLGAPEASSSSELANTEIGRLPAHWSVVALGSVATLASGGTPSKQRAEWWSGPVPWASPKDIKMSRLSDTQDHISLEAAHESSRIVPPGTLLIVIRGMILAKDVPVALTGVPMALNQDLKAVVPKPEVDAEFLLYALQLAKPRLRREIGTSAHGTRRIGTQALERLPIPLPPRDEQTRIAQALAAVDEKVAAEEERRDALRALSGSLLHDLMTARLRVDGLAAESAG
jgi:type I restriction enzyme S subunit